MTDPSTPGRQRAMDALLAGYVAGSLNPYLHALIGAHLIMSPQNRETVRRLEDAAGEALEAEDARPIGRPARDHVLAAIYAGGWYGRPRPERFDPNLPNPIARLLRAPYKDLAWSFAAPGAREHKIHDKDGLSASLLRVAPARKLPSHTHEGREATLVLKGAYSDHLGRYGPGDVALADETVDHRPVAEPGEPCVCFVVVEAPLRLTGPIGGLLQRVFRA